MADSIFKTFVEIKAKPRNRTAKEKLTKERDLSQVTSGDTSRVKKREVTVVYKSASQNVPSQAASVPDAPKTPIVRNAGRSQQAKNRAKYGPVMTSLLPGSPRIVEKRPSQKSPGMFTVPRYPHLQESKVAKPKPSVPTTIVKVEPGAELIWNGGHHDSSQLLHTKESDGISAQMPGPLGRDRELVLGLDFGTSCVKVVVGDKGASKAYAVPFLDEPGVRAYLLPSRLFEQNETFSLTNGTDVHRDLKLRFLANPTSSYLQETLVGFLALVIRRCRAWLFAKHAGTLANRTILWKLVLGRAVDRARSDQVGNLMSSILHAAWMVAGGVGEVNRGACGRELSKHRFGKGAGDPCVEVSVVPELAAQIYGFVQSRQFDPRAKNFYLFVDVGAGTVDVSLFRVKPNEYGTWDFSLFSSIVEPNGAMNLHRARLDWWQQQLSTLPGTQGEELLKAIDIFKSPTEQTQPIPEKYTGYFKGVSVGYSGGSLSPDEMFYMNRLVAQVRGQAIHRTVQQKIVGKIDLDDLPFFLCGGGARHQLYSAIGSELDNAPDFKWLKAHRRELGIPSELEAPGLAQIDYDRLSVAFGLSFVDVGTVAIAKAMKSLGRRSNIDWRAGYTDKDLC